MEFMKNKFNEALLFNYLVELKYQNLLKLHSETYFYLRAVSIKLKQKFQILLRFDISLCGR